MYILSLPDGLGRRISAHIYILARRYFEHAAELTCMLVFAAVAQSVERFLGKDEVMGSNPISSFAVWNGSAAAG